MPHHLDLALREPAVTLRWRAERVDLVGPLGKGSKEQIADVVAHLGEGQTYLATGDAVDIRRDPTPETRAWLAAASHERAERLQGKRHVRRVFIDGGGPSGALAAIHAFNHFPDLEVTIIEQRGGSSLPIVWNNRQNTRNILKFIDPVLERRVFDGHAGAIHSAEYVQDGVEVVGRPKLTKGDESHMSANPTEVATSPSTFQTMSKDEVSLYWDRLHELEHKDLARVERERAVAKAEGRDPSKIRPRLTILRGYEVVALPEHEGRRGVVVREVVDQVEKVGADGEPAKDSLGRRIVRNFHAGQEVPRGWRRVKGRGKERRLGVPDDLLIAEGANSNSRAMAGAEFVDVGPATRFVAGFVDGFKLKALADQAGEGGGRDGVIRRGLKTVVDPETGAESKLKFIAISAAHLKGTWALPEVPARLNFDDPASIKAYFGIPLAKEVAVRTFYKQEIAPLLGVKPEDIPDSAFSFGPGPFVLQSHVAGPPAADASNVHLIGDARGNSHFLTSLGKVTGTGVHQMALNQYWTALAEGRSPALATALLERRLDAGTRAWLKAGLSEFTQVGGVNLGGKAVEQIERLNHGKSFGAQTGHFKVDHASLQNDPTVNHR